MKQFKNKVFFIENEVWRIIPGAESYKVSNKGRVISLNYGRTGQERILSAFKGSDGYMRLSIVLFEKRKTVLVHQIVAMAFLNHKPCGHKMVVNHIDFNRSNNNLSNLELITARENLNQKHRQNTSKYVGVHWCKTKNKYISTIHINGKNKALGSYVDEEEAKEAYLKELEIITKK